MKPPNNDIIPQGFKMTELGALPEEWEVVRLGEIGNIITGNTPSKKKKEYWEKGEIEFIKPPDLQNQKITTFSEKISNSAVRKARIVNKGTILVSCIGIIGRVGLSQKSLAFNQQINAIVPNENIYNHFLFYAIQVQQKQIEKLASFTTVPIVNKAKFSTVKIPLPPLSEQQKIAAVLSAVQEAKEKTEAVIAATKALKKSMMKHLFTYGPVSPQDAENVPLKETEIGLMPEEWEVVRLGEVFKEISKERITLINEEKIYKQLTVKLYSKGIQLREINFGSKIGVKKQYHVSTGDFVFSKIDARNGAYGFISEDLNDGIVSGDFPILQLNKKICNQQFLSYYLSIEKNWIYLRNIAVGTTNRKRVQPKEFLSYLLLPLPPLPTQQKIASILSAIDAKIEAEENKKKAMDDLFKSLLHNLMTAKIRVNQLEVTL